MKREDTNDTRSLKMRADKTAVKSTVPTQFLNESSRMNSFVSSSC